jgi:hypothetical protein
MQPVNLGYSAINNSDPLQDDILDQVSYPHGMRQQPVSLGYTMNSSPYASPLLQYRARDDYSNARPLSPPPHYSNARPMSPPPASYIQAAIQPPLPVSYTPASLPMQQTGFSYAAGLASTVNAQTHLPIGYAPATPPVSYNNADYSVNAGVSPAVDPPANLPAGARYQTTVRGTNGALVDRYVVPQRSSVPVRSVVPEQEEYEVRGEKNVAETQHIQVPRQTMVPVQETIMVPQVRTRMVPKTYMETQARIVNKSVPTVQKMVRSVNKVFEGHKIIESEQVIEYERPRTIQGRFLSATQGNSAEVGVEWTSQYYQQETHGVAAAMGPVQHTHGHQTHFPHQGHTLHQQSDGVHLSHGLHHRVGEYPRSLSPVPLVSYVSPQMISPRPIQRNVNKRSPGGSFMIWYE